MICKPSLDCWRPQKGEIEREDTPPHAQQQKKVEGSQHVLQCKLCRGGLEAVETEARCQSYFKWSRAQRGSTFLRFLKPIY